MSQEALTHWCVTVVPCGSTSGSHQRACKPVSSVQAHQSSKVKTSAPSKLPVLAVVSLIKFYFLTKFSVLSTQVLGISECPSILMTLSTWLLMATVSASYVPLAPGDRSNGVELMVGPSPLSLSPVWVCPPVPRGRGGVVC